MRCRKSPLPEGYASIGDVWNNFNQFYEKGGEWVVCCHGRPRFKMTIVPCDGDKVPDRIKPIDCIAGPFMPWEEDLLNSVLSKTPRSKKVSRGKLTYVVAGD